VLKKIKGFWLESYHSDKVAFYYELTSFIFTVIASLSLAFYARDPNMALIYPAFFIGAVSGAYGYWRRKLPWPLLLTTYFAFVNIFGWGVAMSYW